MYYDMKFRINSTGLTINEAKEMIAKTIAVQGNSHKMQMEIKLLARHRLDWNKIKKNVKSPELELTFDISAKTAIRLTELKGISITKLIPTDDKLKVKALKYDREYLLIKI